MDNKKEKLIIALYIALIIGMSDIIGFIKAIEIEIRNYEIH